MTPGSEGKNEPNESFIFLAEKIRGMYNHQLHI